MGRIITTFDKFNEGKESRKSNDDRIHIRVDNELANIFYEIHQCLRTQLTEFMAYLGESYIITPFNYIKSGDTNDEILFTPTNRLTEFQRKNTDTSVFGKSKDTIKVGRLIRKLYQDNRLKFRISDSEVESIVNLYKESWERSKNVNQNFKVVQGKDIKFWYLIDNYCGAARQKMGTVGRSCMAGPIEQEYLSLYVENPEVCQMVIQCNSNDKLLSRALLWKLTDGTYYLDRVYFTDQHQEKALKAWAKNHYDISSEYTDRDHVPTHLDVQLKKWKFHAYPYMDTMAWLNYYNGLLSSSKKVLERVSPIVSLYSTSGGSHIDSKWEWSRVEKRYIPRKLATWNEEERSYVLNRFHKLFQFYRLMYRF